MPDHPNPDEYQPLRVDRRESLKWGAVAGGSALGGFGTGRAHSGGPRLPRDIEEPGVPAPDPPPLTGGEWTPAPCWHNCGGQRCLLLAYVVDGEVLAVKTDDTHPDTAHTPQMRACARGRAQQGQVFGPDRLRYPMKRRNWEPGGGRREFRGEDEWERISWDEALDLTATELDRILTQHGNEAILELGGTLRRLFSGLGGAVTNWGSTSWSTWLDTGPRIGLVIGALLTASWALWGSAEQDAGSASEIPRTRNTRRTS